MSTLTIVLLVILDRSDRCSDSSLFLWKKGSEETRRTAGPD